MTPFGKPRTPEAGVPAARKRIFELDFLRGAALLAMCFDHFCFDCALLPQWFPGILTRSPAAAALFRFGVGFSESLLRAVGHYVFVCLFLLLAGIGCTLSHSIFRKTGRTALGALCITGATLALRLWFRLDLLIVFGILHAMTVAFLVYGVLSRIWDNRWLYLGVGVAVTAAGFLLRWYDAPVAKTLTADTFWRIAVGTLSYGGDWFPIFPWVGVALCGAFLGKTLYASRRSLLPDRPYRPAAPVCAVGRHSLAVYLLHQPLIAGLLFLLCTILDH